MKSLLGLGGKYCSMLGETFRNVERKAKGGGVGGGGGGKVVQKRLRRHRHGEEVQ